MNYAAGSRQWDLDSTGTFNHNKGTVSFIDGGGDDKVECTLPFYNLNVHKTDNDWIHYSNIEVLNDLDIDIHASHHFRTSSAGQTVTVHGKTNTSTGKVGDLTQYSGTNSWGMLTVKSGEFILSTGTNNVTGIRNVGGTISQS